MRVHYRSRPIWILIGAALLITLSSGRPVSLRSEKTTQTMVAGVANQVPRSRRKRPTSVMTVPPRVNEAPSQANEPLTIRADKKLIQVGETVTFVLEPKKYFDHSRPTVEFNFGDGKTESKDPSKTEVQHQFTSAGQFMVSVKIGSPPGIALVEVIDPITITVAQVKLSVNPRSVEVGMPVSLQATSVSKDPNLRYKFLFGDNKQTNWQESNEATHSYSAAGDYKATVEIGFGDNAVRLDSNDSDSIKVTLPPPQSIDFRVRPSRVDANETVTLSVRFRENGRNIKYRFLFDDGQTSEWQDEGQITHSYVAGTYQPTAEAGVLIDGTVIPLVTATPKTVEVAGIPSAASPTPTQATSPTPSPPPVKDPILILIWLAIAAVVLVSSYKAVKWAYTPKPTFVAFTDIGTATMDQNQITPLSDFELHLDPNVGEGSYDISKSEQSLIRAERSHP